MQLQPTRREARTIVVCLFTFWSLSCAVYELAESWAVLLYLVAFGAGGTLYFVLFRIAARETGRRPGAFWGGPVLAPKGDRRALYLDTWRVLLRLVDPRWYVTVARATGWHVPTTLIALALVFATAAATFLGFFGDPVWATRT